MEKILEKASEEQLAFIIDTDVASHSKLLATAGSGKTFSIIAKAWNLIEHRIVLPEQLYVLTFSRQARHDFVRKVDRMKAGGLINKSNIRTIDSFAKCIIDPDNTVDLSILSYTLREFLRETDLDTLKQTKCLDEIKYLFVDEAQDLNKTQYDIICLLRDRLGVIVNLIGDPNQNIFQFRGGCDKYLVDFPGKVFELTTNYRSFKHLVEFSNPLRKYNEKGDTVKWVSESSRQMAKVSMFGYDTNAQYEGLLVSLIEKLRSKIPLHKVAILAPTRGYLGKHGRHRGLCYIANLLHSHNIPAQLLYDDMADKNVEGGRECEEREGFLTLMTYTSSKGLEWDYVILVDVNAYLISRRNYSKARFEEEQYLMYVATTRAKKGMYVFTKTGEANPWLELLDKDTYSLANPDRFGIMSRDDLDMCPKKDADPDPMTHIPSLVYSLGEEALYQVNNDLKVDTLSPQDELFLSSPSSMGEIDNNKYKFVQKFLRLVFQDAYYHQHHADRGVSRPKLPRIESVLKDANVVFCDNGFVSRWYETNKEDGWENYHQLVREGRVPNCVMRFIDEHINKNKEMCDYILVSDKFYNAYILGNKEMIQQKYQCLSNDGYNDDNIDQRLEILLYLSALDYAIATMHYFYISDYLDMFGQFLLGEHGEHVRNIVKSTKSIDFLVKDNIQVERPRDSNSNSNVRVTGVVDYIRCDDGSCVFLHVSLSPDLRLQDCLNYLLHDFYLNKGSKRQAKATVLNLALGTTRRIQADITCKVLNHL